MNPSKQVKNPVADLLDATADAKQLLQSYANTDFASGTHTHILSDVEELVDALASKYDSSHVGTTANKLVQLTAAAKLPAVDGSLLTNLPDGKAGFPQSLQDVALSNLGSNPIPTDYFGGFLWGVNDTTGEISKSSNFGTSWTQVRATSYGGIVRIAPCSDGEVLLVSRDAIRKSSGWASNPATATFSTKMTVTSGGYTSILRWGFDSDETGTRFIAVEYAGTPGWATSRQGRISTDSGETFTLVYDSLTRYGSTANDNTHIHSACIQKRGASYRYWIAEGHSAPGGVGGLYFSDDSGSTWTHLTSSTIHYDGAFTTLTATDYGLVCGSDNVANGVFLLPDSDDPTAVEAIQLWKWNEQALDGLLGFAERGYKDPDTGIVYIGFTVGLGTSKTPIVATDGRFADLVNAVSDTGATGDSVANIVVKDGKLIAYYKKTGGTVDRILKANVNDNFAFKLKDRTGVLEGTAASSSIAIGISDASTAVGSVLVGHLSSLASTVEKSVVLGYDCDITGNGRMVVIGPEIDTAAENGVIIGRGSTMSGSFQVCIGSNCSLGSTGVVALGSGVAATGNNAVAVGFSITASGTDTVAIGKSLTALSEGIVIGNTSSTVTGGNQATLIGSNCFADLHSVVIGYASSAGQYSVAIGRGVTSGSAGALTGYVDVAIGNGASATGVGSTVIGASSSCTHNNSSVLGYNLASTAADQVKLGARHIELNEMTAPSAGATNSARIFSRDNGSGKTQVCVIFPTGAIQVLATEP